MFSARFPCLAMMVATSTRGAQVTNAGQFPTRHRPVHRQHTARSAPHCVDMDQPIGGNPQHSGLHMERRMRQLNAVQHKSMVDDTEKLLRLVTELNSEDQSHEHLPTRLLPEQASQRVAE